MNDILLVSVCTGILHIISLSKVLLIGAVFLYRIMTSFFLMMLIPVLSRMLKYTLAAYSPSLNSDSGTLAFLTVIFGGTLTVFSLYKIFGGD